MKKRLGKLAFDVEMKRLNKHPELEKHISKLLALIEDSGSITVTHPDDIEQEIDRVLRRVKCSGLHIWRRIRGLNS